MFSDRQSIKSLDRIQERALRLALNDYTSTYEGLLSATKCDSVHYSHIKKVAIEMYKVMNDISPPIIGDIFRKIESNISRSGSRFEYPYRKSEFKGNMSLRCFGPVVWDMLPKELKLVDNLDEFKAELKNGLLAANVAFAKTM